MSLRRKVILIIFITLSILILLLYKISEVILLQSYTDLETDFVERNLERATIGIENKITNLETHANDWASWDDTYAFVQFVNQDYIDSNLIEGTFATLPLNLMVFTNVMGEIVYGKQYLPGEGLSDIPADILAHFSPKSNIFQQTQTLQSVTGITTTPEHILLFAALPVLTSLDEGPVQGMLVFGCYVDTGTAAELSELTQVETLIYRFDAPQLPEDARTLQTNRQNAIHPVDENRIVGYSLMNDVEGNPALILSVVLSRRIYMQGVTSIQYLLLTILISGSVIGITILLLLENTLLSRLARVSQSVSAISGNAYPISQIKFRGKDELAHLVDTVNDMLERLGQSQRSVRESEERLRMVVSNVPILIFILNENGEFTFVEGQGLPAFTAQRLLHRPALEIFGFVPQVTASKLRTA